MRRSDWLARSTYSVVHEAALPVRQWRPSSLIGQGAVENLAQIVEQMHVEVAVIDATVSPVQQRNLERAWNCKVIDRYRPDP